MLVVVFWLLAAYYIAVLVFALCSKSVARTQTALDGEWPAVAILYTTYNDFQLEAALSCLKQDYPNAHLFLLDDSTLPESCVLVSAFHAAHPQSTTLVRRPTRQGFKAGNLNNALRGVAAEYPLFAVVDADERLPVDFLRQVVLFMQDSALAFVQANHAPNKKQASVFAHDIAATILPFWHIHCGVRNRYGLVMFLGHGALVRRSAWEIVNGFPEVISEDLAFSATLAAKGLRGVFLEDVVCYEDFASGYQAFKNQQERYIIGTTQVIRRYFGQLLFSSTASPIEKIDFLLWCAPLYVPALVLLFVALCTLGFPLVFGYWHTLRVSLNNHDLALLPIIRVDKPFSLLWSPDFQVLSGIYALAPTFAIIALGITKRLSAPKSLFLSTVPYLSLMVVSWQGLLRYVLTGRVSWLPTGEQAGRNTNNEHGSKVMRESQSHLFERDRYNSIGWEFGIGLLLALASLLSGNLYFFTLSSCILLGIGIELLGWEQQWIRCACTICCTIILAQIVLGMLLPGTVNEMTPFIFSVHF